MLFRVSGRFDMLKRFFPVPLASALSPSMGGNTTMSRPQPIDNKDKQRLVKLSDAPSTDPGTSTMCVSDWADYSRSSHLSTGLGASLESGEEPGTTPAPRALFPPAHLSATIASAPTQEPNIHQLTAAESLLKEQRSVHQLKQYIQRQQRLQSVERKLRRSLDFSTLTGTAVVETAVLFNAKQVSLMRYSSEQQRYEPIVRYCQNQEIAWQPRFAVDSDEFPYILQQLQQGKLLSLCPVPSDATLTADTSEPVINVAEIASNENHQWLQRWSGTWLLIPIHHPQNVPRIPTTGSITSAQTGEETAQPDDQAYRDVMALCLSERESWTEEAIAAAHSITVELSLAIQQSQQRQALIAANQELQKLALSDGLTSLANRRRFDEHLTDEWQRLARDKQPLSLILCDLDHFKRFNDTFGHPAGDRCLIRVARALLSGPQRPADLVARYGGEEFAVILPNTDTHGAWRIAQKIHESIRALRIEHAPDNEEPYVTVTMGVSTIIPGHDNTPQMLVQASDLALYHAKQHGRNRTYVNGHCNTVEAGQGIGQQHNNEDLDVMPS